MTGEHPHLQSPAVPAKKVQLSPGIMCAAEGIGILACVALFLIFFNHERPQFVDGLWLVSIVLCISLVKSFAPGPLIDFRVRPTDLAPLMFILLVFVAAWLPFYDNWRWAYTGDSFGVFAQGYWLGRNGVRQSLLSMHGIEDSFSYLWEVSYNFPMLLFSPTLFWHRIGQLLWACLALTTIYAYFTLVLGRYWAAAIAAATAMNYVWLWFSYVSYLKLDSFVFYFLTLIFATLLWRRPDRLAPWMLCGITGGLSLFFTQTAWSAVILVGLGLGVFGLATRRFAHVAVYGGSFLLAATPILIEIPWLLSMATRFTGQAVDSDYLERIFKQIILLAYDFDYQKLGVQGAFLRWPLGSLYLVGLLTAAVGLLPALRRRLRVPAVAPALLMLFLWDAVLLTLTNKGYGQPSTKRAYNLIPLQIFFAFLPLMVMSAWTTRCRWGQRVVVGLVVAALTVYGARNLQLMMYPEPNVYGGNLFDGMIELRQRFPERQVVLFTQRQGLPESLARTELLHQAYHVADQLTLTADFSRATVAHACQQNALVCYEPNYDRERMELLFTQFKPGMQRFPLLNSFEMVCFQCPAGGVGVGR